MSIKSSIVLAFHCPYDFSNNRFYKREVMSNRLLYKVIGPFQHVAILCGASQKKNYINTFYSIYITKRTSGKIFCGQTTFTHPGYCFYRIPATVAQQKRLTQIALELSAKKTYLSTWKLSGLNRWTNDLDIRTRKDQLGWICTELSMFLLQEAGIISNETNPKQFTPTEMFEYLAKNRLGSTVKLYNQSLDAFETYKRYKDS